MSIQIQYIGLQGVSSYCLQANAPAQFEVQIPKGSMLLPLITVPQELDAGFVIHYMTPFEKAPGHHRLLLFALTNELFLIDELFTSLFLGTYMEGDKLVYVFANLMT